MVGLSYRHFAMESVPHLYNIQLSDSSTKQVCINRMGPNTVFTHKEAYICLFSKQDFFKMFLLDICYAYFWDVLILGAVFIYHVMGKYSHIVCELSLIKI